MDNQNRKLRTSCEENPRLGHNQRYVNFLSNGLKLLEADCLPLTKSTKYCSIILKLKHGYQYRRTRLLH